MPAFCAVVNCGNRSNRDRKSFFRLPGTPKRATEERKNLYAVRRIKWLLALRRADLNEKKIQYLRICGDHFITGRPAMLQDTEHPDWVPSKNMGYKTNLDEPKHNQSVKKKHKCEVDTDLSSSDEGIGDDTFGKTAMLQDTEYPGWMSFKDMSYETNLNRPIIHQFERIKHRSEVDTDSFSFDEATGEDDPSSKSTTTQDTKYADFVQSENANET